MGAEFETSLKQVEGESKLDWAVRLTKLLAQAEERQRCAKEALRQKRVDLFETSRRGNVEEYAEVHREVLCASREVGRARYEVDAIEAMVSWLAMFS